MGKVEGDNSVSRRGALRMFLVPLTGLAVQKLLSACSDDEQVKNDEVGEADAAAADAARPAAASLSWASGGTKSMKGGYPDPFANNPGTACELTKSMILGPCYAETLEREDISEGVSGVPMRLSLLVIRADGCMPVAGATVDVWHAGVEGVYSEFAAGTACNPGAIDQTMPKFCRGVQTTNGEGRVDFNTIVPGWYAGRAVHVHFTVRVDGEEYVTSQLFFDDALLDEIEKQPEYVARGTRDTRNGSDLILPADGSDPYVLNAAKRADGALHAWKVLTLRASLSDELPAAPGGFPGGGIPGGPLPEGGVPGGPPPAGGFPGSPQLDGGT